VAPARRAPQGAGRAAIDAQPRRLFFGRREKAARLPRLNAFISIDGLTKRYGSAGRSRTVFEDLRFAIGEGEFVTVVGPSGCGKSTLLKSIAGLVEPSAGSVRFLGKPVTAPPREMVYVFQQYEKSIFPWLTVRENVRFGIRKLDRGTQRARVKRFIDRVGLSESEDYYPSQLSGGMQQRVALARALACQPAVLLMDEPFSAVDALTRANLQQLVLELWQELKLTVVFVTHDVDEAVFLSSRAIALAGQPARIDLDLPIELPYPRDPVRSHQDPRFLARRSELYLSITGKQ
jgi:NitT/TauT family transport system ATP-binding protein